MGHLTTLLSRTSKTFWLTFLAVFLLGAVLFSRSSPDPPQPISFNHRKHVDAGLDCADCHTGVREQARATLPAISVCLMCHENPVTQSPEEAKIRQASAKGEPLTWQSPVRLPRHVYFSHRRHVALGKLDCAACHGKVGQSTAPSNMPAFKFTMERCMDCHASHKLRNDCNDCHR